MRMIAISRESGSGGRELGKRLALTVNTQGWGMEELASAVEGFILRWYGR